MDQPLMQQQAEQPPQQDQPIDPSMPPQGDNDGDESNGVMTIDCDQLEKSFADQMDAGQKKDFEQLIDAGNDLLFGEKTHYKLMDQLQGSKDIGNDLGGGAFGLMVMLLKSSKNMPPPIIIPAGVVLICRASEFLNKSGMAQVTDDDYDKATHLFGVKMMNTFDPKFRAKMQEYAGSEQQSMPQEPSQEQPQAPQGGMGGTGAGMLDMTGAQ